MNKQVLLISTRKGLFLLHAEDSGSHWRTSGPHFLGSSVHHAVLDPRDGKTLLVCARPGHLGPTVFRSTDLGEHWKEAAQPPAFATTEAPATGRVVDHVFWLTPGHAGESDVWYAGTSPAGLFRSNDGGASWKEVEGFNRDYFPGIREHVNEVPGGSLLHSINVDPRDARHLYIALSSGGVFESTDAGARWHPLNRGCAADFMPDPNAELGHDPHCVALHPLAPDRLYQQNHCGIYRLERPGDIWRRIGNAMPREIGDIGFPIVLHPRDPDTVWVFPMDGTETWPRTSPGGRPAVYRSGDGGETWSRQDSGLPARAWWTVKRQCFCAAASQPVGLYFGTTSGEVWGSGDEGAHWLRIAEHLPEIQAVTIAYPR
jgi:photosystem II stability/assembly factor-like uncharacterized protein